MPLKLITAGGGSVILDANTTGSTYTINVPPEGGSMITSGSLSGINASAISTGTLPKANFPSGCVLQVVQTTKTDMFSTYGTSFVDITGMSASITPTRSTSKILIDVVLSCGEDSDSFPGFYVRRNGTIIVLGDAVGSGTRTTFGYCNTGANSRDQYLLTPVTFRYLDSPSTTSSVTYQIQVRPMSTVSGARTFYLNRSSTVGDANQMTAISTITLTEVAQ